MSINSDKTAAELQREINQDRQRIEDKLNAIQERLTPGQVIDEALGYIKARGATEYFSNLGQAAKTNPLPLALVGVGLAWLMASPSSRHQEPPYDRSNVDDEYPVATVTGRLRRTRPSYIDGGRSYSDFADDTGKRFKALTDEAGCRAGNFVDDTGRYFRGFADSTGNKITDFRDETGAMFDDASGWASDTWAGARESMQNMVEGISSTADTLRDSSSNAMDSLKQQSGQLNELFSTQFRDQPLVGGALAFAVGAALGAALPHTRQEDQLMGEAADKVRSDALDQASDLADKGTKVAGDVYDKAVTVAADVHDAAKDRIMEEAGQTRRSDGSSGNGQPTAH